MRMELCKCAHLVSIWIIIMSSGCATQSTAPDENVAPSMFTGKRIGTIQYKKNTDGTFVGGYRREGDSKTTWLSPKGEGQQPVSTNANKSANVVSVRSFPPPIEELKGVLLRTLYPAADDHDDLVFSSDGRWLIAKNQSNARGCSASCALISIATGTEQKFGDQMDESGYGAMSISADSEHVAVLSRRKQGGSSIKVYRLSDMSLISQIQDPSFPTTFTPALDIWWMPDNKSLLLQNDPGHYEGKVDISLLSLESSSRLWTVNTNYCVEAISRDGQYIACSMNKWVRALDQKCQVQIVSKNRLSLIASYVSHMTRIDALLFSPDSDILATAGYDGTSKKAAIELWSFPDVKLLHTFYGYEREINALRFSPDGKTLVSVGWDNTIRFMDLDRRTQIGEIRLSSALSSVDIDPYGRTVAFGDWKGRISVCDYTATKALAARNESTHQSPAGVRPTAPSEK